MRERGGEGEYAGRLGHYNSAVMSFAFCTTTISAHKTQEKPLALTVINVNDSPDGQTDVERDRQTDRCDRLRGGKRDG